MKLKNRSGLADGMAMFSTTKKPLPLSEACLQSVCASLNAPIVHVEGLPAGPARCGIVVYAEQYGDLGMAVVVRSLESGEFVLMRAQESLPPDADPKRALEMVMSHAEGLGFVFDDDMLAGHATHEVRTAALDHWQGLQGSDEVFAASDVASPPEPTPRGDADSPELERMPEMEDLLSAAAEVGEEPVDFEIDELSMGDLDADDLSMHELETGGDELLLEEIAPLEIDDEAIGEVPEGLPSSAAGAPRRRAAGSVAGITEPIELEGAPTSRRAAAPKGEAFAASPLSKFRRPDDARAQAGDGIGSGNPDGAFADTPDDDAAGGSALGRVKIVRMRKARDGRAPARGRVLASY
jgi:hypothetical protein